MNRRAATAEDMTIGAIVFKGNGKVAFRVMEAAVVYDGTTRYAVKKATSTGSSLNGCGSWLLRNFTVED